MTNIQQMHYYHIWAENKPVEEHNMKHLQRLPTQLFVAKAVDQYPQNVAQERIQQTLSKGRSETGGLDSEIFIKEGARVMLTTNIDIADRLINGQMGTVIKIAADQTGKPAKIYVKFDDSQAGTMTIDRCKDSYSKENKVVPVSPILARIKIRSNKGTSPEIQRIQFPLTLAWACTIHKVQGLTLQNIVIGFNLFKQKSFNYGQIYVALSRATTLLGIFIIGTIDSKHIKADPRVHEEYKRLRATAKANITQLHQNLTTEISGSNPSVYLTLLNVRSLSKHSIDVKHNPTVFNLDVLLLTETQLKPSDPGSEIRRNLHPFELYRQDSTDRFSSLAVCYRNAFHITDYQYFSSINGLKFVVHNQISQKSKVVLLLYRKHNSKIHQYVNTIKYLLTEFTFDIILGDFNVNYLNDSEVKELNNCMENYRFTQIVQSATFVSSGTLLDHI